MTMTYIIIIVVVAALITIASLIFPTFRKYVKWIGGGIIAIGGAILLIVTLGKKKPVQVTDGRIQVAEGNVAHDITIIGRTDAEIKASQDAEKARADKAKKDQEALNKKPDKPDQGQAGDDFLDTYK